MSFIHEELLDFICLISPDDIANAVASSFRSSFQTAVQKGINTVLAKTVNTYSTTIPLPFLNLDVQMQSSLSEINNNIVVAAKGAVIYGTHTSPPFTPSFAPPDSVFTTPKGQINVLLTEYFSDTVIWALDQAGSFHYVITDANLPSNTTYKLQTNNPFFLLLCPGLFSYPNLNISITTSLAKLAVTHLDPQGLHVQASVNFNFTIYNSTFSHPGWVYTISDLPLVVYLAHTTGPTIVFDSFNITGWNSDVELTQSWLGTVETIGVAVIIDAALTVFVSDAKLPPQIVSVPPAITLSNLGHTFATGYDMIFTDAKYQQPPSERCGDGSFCPVGNTCCDWGGHWGCCPLPNANCCSKGCCQRGCQCDGGFCDCFQRYFRMLPEGGDRVTFTLN